jgi:hypothetical protein
MSNDRTLSRSTVTAIIQLPLEEIDIAEWLFHLPDAEYLRCSPDHLAAGSSTTEDGRPMSINVETVGGLLCIQHYVAEAYGPHLCRMVSTSDLITPAGRTKCLVVWELSAKALDAGRCEYQNHIHALATDETIAFFEAHGTSLEDGRPERQAALDAHNQGETPNFASSIALRASSRVQARRAS